MSWYLLRISASCWVFFPEPVIPSRREKMGLAQKSTCPSQSASLPKSTPSHPTACWASWAGAGQPHSASSRKSKQWEAKQTCSNAATYLQQLQLLPEELSLNSMAFFNTLYVGQIQCQDDCPVLNCRNSFGGADPALGLWGDGFVCPHPWSLPAAKATSLLLEFQCSGILGGLFLLLVALP